MSWSPISGTMSQYHDSLNQLASGYYLKFYESGTTTPFNMSVDVDESSTLDKCQLDSSGYPTTDGTTRFIPFVDRKYKIALYKNSTDADNNTTANADWLIDKIDKYQISREGAWDLFTGTPTQIDASSFSVTGDQTAIFTVGTRLRLDDVSTLYGIVTASAFTTVTTVTVTLDTGNLSGSLTAVSTGISTTAGKEISTETITYNTRQTSSVNRDLKSVLEQSVRPEDYGATGDGVTDDTAALQAALNQGGEVVLQGGKTYVVTGIVNFSSNTTLLGNGATIKYSSMPTGTGGGFAYVALYADAKSDIKIFDLEIDGNKSTYSPTDAFGITFRNCNNVEVAHCKIHDCWRIGIFAGHVTTGQTTNAFFHHNYIYNIGDATEATQYGNGIAIVHAQYVMIDSNIIENIYGTGGINLEGDTYDDITIIGNYIKAGTGSNLRGIVQYEAGSDVHNNIVVTGNIVVGQPGAGISFAGNGRRVISSNIVVDCGEEGIKQFTAASSDTIIADNMVINCGSVGTAGINVATGESIVVSGNVVKDCPANSTVGITVTATQSADITNNTVNDAQTNAFELGVNNFVFTGNKANNIGAIGSGTNYFLKNRTSFTCTDGVVANNVLDQGGGTATAFWLINGSNWVNVEAGANQSNITKYSISSASGCSVKNIEGPNAPDLSGVFGNTAAWTAGDLVWNSTRAIGESVGWRCISSGTPGTWAAFGAHYKEATIAQLTDSTNAINTDASKVEGFKVLNLDTGLYNVAAGNGNNDVWVAEGTGTTLYTPT